MILLCEHPAAGPVRKWKTFFVFQGALFAPSFARAHPGITAHARTCSHSAVFCFTSRRRQQPMHRPRTSLLPGSAPSAKARCASSNDSPLPRSSSRKPDWHVLMTRPDRLLNPATLACVFPCSLQVCPEVGKRLLCRFNHQRRMASQAWLMHTFFGPIPPRRAPFATTAATEAVENP
jgi:hypothetical protein